MKKIFLACVITLTLLVSCQKEKYRVGRDTYRQFGDGRFELVRQSGNIVMADNEDEYHFPALHVISYTEIDNVLYLITQNYYTYTIIDLITNRVHIYYKFDDIPIDKKSFFETMVRNTYVDG